MPFRPCCSRVGRLLDPDLCCSCVGCSSPGQPSRLHPGPGPVTPARAPARGCQRRPFFTRCRQPPEDRLPPASRWPASHPVTPSARPGRTHRDEQSMRRRIKSTHIADSARLISMRLAREGARRSASSVRPSAWSDPAWCAVQVGQLRGAGCVGGAGTTRCCWPLPAVASLMWSRSNHPRWGGGIVCVMPAAVVSPGPVRSAVLPSRVARRVAPT
jgi:hypothetical protein